MNQKIAPIDSFRTEIGNSEYQKQILNYLGGDEARARKFSTAIVYSVRKIPKLLDCERSSVLEAFMQCVEYDLYPSSASGEAYVIPYKDKAQFQLGYQGVITLLYRAGVESINSNIVYENDLFDYQEGLDPVLHHKPTEFGHPKGKAIGVYAVASVNGQRMFHVMSEEDIMKYKGFSKSASKDFSPWNEKSDPEKWMWRKTCIKQLAKTLPKNDTLSNAIAKDNEDSSVAERRTIDVMELKDAAPTMRKLNTATDDKTEKEGPKKEGEQDTIFSASDSSAGPKSK